MNRRLAHLVPGLALAMVVSGRALAGTIPESERWATVTHAGNAPYPSEPQPFGNYPYPPGRVDYEYQISRTETTGAEWFEFVQAYAPYVNENDAPSSLFISHYIDAVLVAPGLWEYTLRANRANHAVAIGWRYAARYCNWLHNGKQPEQAAFESGVYDTSTFGGNPLDGYTDQQARSPGATYFIPTIDEWVKAGYFDPDRYGPGQPGYWQYPNGTDNLLISGVPGVGETSAAQFGVFQVGAYTDTQSPWGLWDVSGGQTEMMESVASLHEDGRLRSRMRKGTHAPSGNPEIVLEWDHIDWLSTSGVESVYGVRIARLIPAPGAVFALGWCVVSLSSIRQRR